MLFRLLRSILFLFCFACSLWFSRYKYTALLCNFPLWCCDNHNPVTSFFFFFSPSGKYSSSVKMGSSNLWVVGNFLSWELNKEILNYSIFTYLPLICPLYPYQVAHIARLGKGWVSLMQLWFFTMISFWLSITLIWSTILNKRRENSIP